MQFEGAGKVFETLRRITGRLDDLGISHAVVGGMALFMHGFQRTTDDVDLLVTREGLKRIHENLEGLGYVAPFTGSKNLRDVLTGVKIEFLIQGDYPGDGKPKPVQFPDPDNVVEIIGGLKCINLQTLINLKLASGLTAPHRLKDLADVQEIIRVLRLELEFGEKLDLSVRDAYRDLWQKLSSAGTA